MMRSIRLLALIIFILVLSSLILRNLALISTDLSTTTTLFEISYILISPLSFIPIYLSYRPIDLTKEYKKLLYVPFFSSILASSFAIPVFFLLRNILSSQPFNQEITFYPFGMDYLQSAIFLAFDMTFITFTAMFLACMRGKKDTKVTIKEGRGSQVYFLLLIFLFSFITFFLRNYFHHYWLYMMTELEPERLSTVAHTYHLYLNISQIFMSPLIFIPLYFSYKGTAIATSYKIILLHIFMTALAGNMAGSVVGNMAGVSVYSIPYYTGWWNVIAMRLLTGFVAGTFEALRMLFMAFSAAALLYARKYLVRKRPC
jgi:hypothetical protein